MDTSNANAELWAALAAAQADIQNPTKNAVNPHFKNKYADLAEVLKTVLPTFSAHKLAIVQSTSFDSATNLVSVSTVVAHASGGFVTSEARCVPGKMDAQGVGAATTYLRRYALCAMSGVAQEDDDGNSARHEDKKHHEPSQALLSILAKIQSFLTVEGLESIKPEIRALSPTERGLAIQAGIERKQWIEQGDTDG
jgi:hypothetical protein